MNLPAAAVEGCRDLAASPLLRELRAWLPYRAPSGGLGFTVGVEGLKPVTILVGSNASGKTALLESIGLLVAALQSPEEQVVTLSILSVLRPHHPLPIPAAVWRRLGDSETCSVYVEVPVKTSTSPRVPSEAVNAVLRGTRLMEVWAGVAREVTSDVDALLSVISFLRKERVGLWSWEDVTRVGEEFSDAVARVVGEERDMAYVEKPFRVYVVEGYLKIEAYTAIHMTVKKLTLAYIIYSLSEGGVAKTVILDSPNMSVSIRKAGEAGPLQVLIYHPCLTYMHAVLEKLCYYATRRYGLPNREEAVEILRKAISQLKNIRPAPKALHLETRGRGHR